MLDMDIINAAMVRQNTDPEAAAARRAANEAIAKKTELNQEDFLTLMITQLKNQDPMKPMDPAQYVGQLAQFSSVSGLAEMNKQIGCAHQQPARQPGAGRRRPHRPHRDRVRQRHLSARSRRGRGRADRRASSTCPPAPPPCSSWSRTRAARWCGPQALDTARGPQAFTWDGTTNNGARSRRPVPTTSKSSPRWAMKTFLSRPASRRACRACRSTRPAAR